jgi:hypothetical protein
MNIYKGTLLIDATNADPSQVTYVIEKAITDVGSIEEIEIRDPMQFMVSYVIEADDLWEVSLIVQELGGTLVSEGCSYEAFKPYRIGPPPRVLTVRYDVSGLSDGEVGVLAGEAEAQADRSKSSFDDDPGHPSVSCTVELSERVASGV